MKNKSLTYVLLFVVAFIWYKVFVRVAGNFEDEAIEINTLSNTNTAQLSVHRDTFELNASYADPFRVGRPVSKVVVNPINEVKPPKQEKPKPVKPQLSWPSIKYKGLVKRTSSNDPLALVIIDGNPLHMRRGESMYDGIILKSIFRDSIHIVYKKEKRTFGRE